MFAGLQAALIGRAMGSDVDVPDPAEFRRSFDEQLVAVPEQVDVDRLVLMDALGLGQRRAG